MTWEPCATCCGQRVVLVAHGEGLAPVSCPSCLGLGERLAEECPDVAPDFDALGR